MGPTGIIRERKDGVEGKVILAVGRSVLEFVSGFIKTSRWALPTTHRYCTGVRLPRHPSAEGFLAMEVENGLLYICFADVAKYLRPYHGREVKYSGLSESLSPDML